MFMDFFAFINNTYILDIIPLDSFLHFLVGAIITIIGLKYKFRLFIIFLLLLGLGLIKELNDYFFVYRTGWFEYISDILASFIYLPVILFVRKSKQKLSYKINTSTKRLKF